MENLFPVNTKVTSAQRQQLLRQKPCLIWFTGLSGSGKTTLAVQLESQLFSSGFKTYLLDGDNVRMGLNKDLTFTDEGRVENIRRIGEVSRLFLDAGIIVLTAFISPFRADRQQVCSIVGPERFVEAFADCPIEVCEQRDVKGLYKKARTGGLKNFTGIDSPYEPPEKPDIRIPTHELEITESVDRLVKFILPMIRL